MRISHTISMREYDELCRQSLHGKIPNWSSRYFSKRMGDCIYDFTRPGRPRLRRSVHTHNNRAVDLRGKKGLLSDHFFYFGNRPRSLPSHLLPIVQRTQGHKSRSNGVYVDQFVTWIHSLKLRPNRMYGEPIEKRRLCESARARAICSNRHHEADCQDEIC